MFFNENLNRFYPFDADFISRNRSEYDIKQLELLRSGIIDFGLVLYDNTKTADLWTDGILEGTDSKVKEEVHQAVVTLQKAQNKKITITVDGEELVFNFESATDFATQTVYFDKGYCFLTIGLAASIINTDFNPTVLVPAERIVTTAQNQITSVNGITNKTLVFQNGKNSRCSITGNDLYVTTSVPPLNTDLEGLVVFLGAKGKNITMTSCSELSITAESNVVTISINDELFNRLNCYAD
jgi:hypothetical protein